ncbi:MAG: hypothetical protein ABL907_12880 [Hyphomicrobium sp.]
MTPLRVLPVAFALTLGGIGLAHAEPLSGTWSGSGYVQPKDGQREKVRCRVSYSPQGSQVVAVSATCASASMTIHQTGSLSMVSASRYVGDFHNPEFDVSGRVRVTISGASQTVTFSGARGGGSLNLHR